MSDRYDYFERNKNAIFKILNHCKTKVPYYKKNWNFEIPKAEDLTYDFFAKHIPILNKDQIMEYANEFISSNFNIDDLVSDYTSGSTGKPLRIYKTKSEAMQSAMNLLNQRRKYLPDITNATTIRFLASRSDDGAIMSEPVCKDGKSVYISLMDLSFDSFGKKYWPELENIEFAWILATSSVVVRLAKFIEKHQKNPKNIKFIELTSEFVSPEQLNYIKQVFSCPVVCHYGSREFWCIAYSCEYDKYHLLDNHFFVEAIDKNGNLVPDGEEGEIVVTSMKQFAMPLIRYKLGDIVKIKFLKCECGNTSPILDICMGRISEYIVTKTGKIVSLMLVHSIVRQINYRRLIIQQCQLVQDDFNRFTVNLCINDINKKDVIEEAFKTYFKKYVDNDVKLFFSYVDVINPDPKTGKVKSFIQNTQTKMLTSFW